MLTTIASDDGATAQIVHHGAQLASWIPANQGEQLFLSAASPVTSGKALRGGVPVIFPQFSDYGPLPRHGFARNLEWQKRDSQPGNRAVFELRDSDITRAIWPHSFLAELTFTVSGDALNIDLAIHNTGNATFDFTAALHTYLRVAHISETGLIGLQGLSYREQGQQFTETAEVLHIDGPVDRVYFNTPSALEVRQARQRVRVTSSGFADTVVWNPWKEASDAMADMEPDGYERMVCVESAAVGQAVSVQPGAVWRASQRLQAIPSQK